jgi:hypothetical protein
MARNMKPVVKHAPGHDRTSRVESIYEFSAVVDGELRGGLLSLRVMNDGTLRVDAYRCDPGVWVVGPERAAASDLPPVRVG